MTCKASDIAEDIKDWLNGGSYVTSVTAEMLWAPRLDRKELQALQVAVLPGVKKTALLGRGPKLRSDYQPVITIGKAVDHAVAADVNTLGELLEQLEARVWEPEAFTIGGVDYIVVGTEAELSQEMLWEDRIFAGFITVSVRQAGLNG